MLVKLSCATKWRCNFVSRHCRQYVIVFSSLFHGRCLLQWSLIRCLACSGRQTQLARSMCHGQVLVLTSYSSIA